ncbi:hypothetical protein JW879_04560 [candidate division WOR-3 bacterium]|nr:hypothetical protein [candidate division WOR-3 bacterium]
MRENNADKNKFKKLFQYSLKEIGKSYKKIEKKIKDAPNEKIIIYLGINRFMSHSKAIILLLNNSHNTEALIILRVLIELVVNLRWVLEDKTKKNLKSFLENVDYEFDEEGIPKMGGHWTETNLLERMKEIGFDEFYYKLVIKKLHDEIHANPKTIVRSYGNSLSSFRAESIYPICCQMAGHIIKVANEIFEEKPFIDHNEIFSKIRVNPFHLQKIKDKEKNPQSKKYT